MTASPVSRIGYAALALALAGCMTKAAAPTTPAGADAQASRGITVTEGGETVAKDETITLTPEAAPGSRALAATTPFDYAIQYVAKVPPVKVGSDTVQANDILVCPCGSGAYIAYNIAGDDFGGAIQIIDTSDKSHPSVVREIKLPEMDVNALYQDGNTLYFGGQANPDAWPFKSYIGKVDLVNPDGVAIAASFKSLRSHAVTSITKANGKFYVGVGARDGGVEILKSDLSPESFKAYPDVRSVQAPGGVVHALVGTVDGTATVGRLVKLGTTDSVTTLDNFRSTYTKATLDMPSADLAFLGMSASGFQVLKPGSASKVFSLANPSTSALEATNGVSTDADLAFVANGQYGFRVVQILDRTKTGSAFGRLAGHHKLAGEAYDGEEYSANFLRYRSNHLFVASGLGGVNIYRLTKL